jgi:HK97 family phage prohead protease
MERRCAEQSNAPATARTAMAVREVTDAEFNGAPALRMAGYGSVYESGYEMWDVFGPYTEIVSAGAGAVSLSRTPLVEFVVNHSAGGAIPMAHTRNGSLTLAEDETGLLWDALTDPARPDVQITRSAMERGDLVECSFKFHITSGTWSPDYTEYRIDAYDINRGDVSLVNFGANPATTSWLPRSQSLTQLLAAAGDADKRAAYAQLRTEYAPKPRTDAPEPMRAHGTYSRV